VKRVRFSRCLSCSSLLPVAEPSPYKASPVRRDRCARFRRLHPEPGTRRCRVAGRIRFPEFRVPVQRARMGKGSESRQALIDRPRGSDCGVRTIRSNALRDVLQTRRWSSESASRAEALFNPGDYLIMLQQVATIGGSNPLLHRFNKTGFTLDIPVQDFPSTNSSVLRPC
jgi:hypothetical protein